MKVRILLSSLLAAGMLLTTAVQAHDRDDHRHNDRHSDRYYRGSDHNRGYNYRPREYYYHRESRYYSPRPYYYGSYYYPRRSYYGYGYPYYGDGFRGSVTLSVPLF